MEEAEVDTQIGERTPRHQRGSWKHELMVGHKNSGQEYGEQARQPQQHAVEDELVAGLEFVIERLPQINARKAL